MSPDNDLLSRLIADDRDAFKEVFDRYFRKVMLFVNSYLSDKWQAEDITQNVFIRLWEKRASLDCTKSFDGYIFTIAYRMVIDHFRNSEAVQKRNLAINLMAESICSSYFSDELLNRHQFETLYEQALQSLPEKRKEIFLLSRQLGLTNKEIAEQLQISVKTVENQMTAALAKLREHFKGSDINTAMFFLIFFF